MYLVKAQIIAVFSWSRRLGSLLQESPFVSISCTPHTKLSRSGLLSGDSWRVSGVFTMFAYIVNGVLLARSVTRESPLAAPCSSFFFSATPVQHHGDRESGDADCCDRLHFCGPLVDCDMPSSLLSRMGCEGVWGG
jgi:hypothetical protein